MKGASANFFFQSLLRRIERSPFVGVNVFRTLWTGEKWTWRLFLKHEKHVKRITFWEKGRSGFASGKKEASRSSVNVQLTYRVGQILGTVLASSSFKNISNRSISRPVLKVPPWSQPPLINYFIGNFFLTSRNLSKTSGKVLSLGL